MAVDVNTTIQVVSDTDARVTPFKMFTGFSRIAMCGFGGVMPIAYRGLVEDRKWLTPAEFAELLGLSQMLPGPTVCNIALMVGHRYAGTGGALCALAGLVVFPSLAVITLGVLFQRYGGLELVRSALGGMASVAPGLVFGTAGKLAIAMYKGKTDRNARVMQTILVGLTVAGMVLFDLHLILVFTALVVGGTLMFYFRKGNL